MLNFPCSSLIFCLHALPLPPTLPMSLCVSFPIPATPADVSQTLPHGTPALHASASPSLQAGIASMLAVICQKRHLPPKAQGECILPLVLKHLRSKEKEQPEPEVHDAWLACLQAMAPNLEAELLSKELSEIVTKKSDVTQSTYARVTSCVILGAIAPGLQASHCPASPRCFRHRGRHSGGLMCRTKGLPFLWLFPCCPYLPLHHCSFALCDTRSGKLSIVGCSLALVWKQKVDDPGGGDNGCVFASQREAVGSQFFKRAMEMCQDTDYPVRIAMAEQLTVLASVMGQEETQVGIPTPASEFTSDAYTVCAPLCSHALTLKPCGRPDVCLHWRLCTRPMAHWLLPL